MIAGSASNRRRSPGEAAVGLYAGLGAVALAAYVGGAINLAMIRGQRTYSGPVVYLLPLLLYSLVPVLWVVGAGLAWLWLGLTRRAILVARVSAAAAYLVTQTRVTTHAWSGRPAAQILLPTLLGVALLEWLPAPRAWRRLRQVASLRRLLLPPPAARRRQLPDRLDQPGRQGMVLA
jgi:hypothetical protein